MTSSDEFKKLLKETNARNVLLPKIVIEDGAIQFIPSYLMENQMKNIVIVYDKNTKRAAGNKVEQILAKKQFNYTFVKLKQNKHNQVLADEQSLIQLFNETSQGTDVILAIGSGTIHDIVRFVSYKMDIPFISIPTAASVDGFTSKGAPLIFRGFKNTVQTAAPMAVFADISILIRAPKELTAAGFGDIVGKYTSLLDWNISALVADEPYNKRAAEITKQSLESCVNNVEEIAKNSEVGINVLMRALIDSGLVMLILDFSRPASGSEHHLSHYWEMSLLQKDAKQLLHGAKVGVASTIIIDIYKKFFTYFDINSVTSREKYSSELKKHWNTIKADVDHLPSGDNVRTLLKTVGGPSTPKELSIDNELVTESLNKAIHLRDRCTGLLLINQLKKERIQYPFEY